MTENASAAMFFTRLAGLSGDPAYRDLAVRALKRIPNSHREYGAFAASFGHALARLLSPALVVGLTGRPGAAYTLDLLRAARTQLRHRNIVMRFHEQVSGSRSSATVTLSRGGITQGPISEPAALKPDLLTAGR